MNPQQFHNIVQRYRAGTASEAEKAFLEAYYAAFDIRPDVLQELSEAEADRLGEKMYAELAQQLPAQPQRAIRRWLNTARWRYAAAVLLILGAATFLWFRSSIGNQSSGTTTAASTAGNDIGPGGQKAILMLADGSTIVLDSAANGKLITQQGSEIIKQDGQLIYSPLAGVQATVAYNTMRTPNGGTYQLTLPDGTRVWLNAASSIRYPTAFRGRERAVTVTGEAYFEVTKNTERPFIVHLNNQADIQVLGTQFNVKAYEEEGGMKTTLIEGSVRVRMNSQVQHLKPGQQAQMRNAENINVVNADIHQVTAWKNGLFNFNGQDFQSVMREIARWYDLEVVYEVEPAPQEIAGKMQRNLHLSQVMHVLKGLEIDYRLEGRTLIITK